MKEGFYHYLRDRVFVRSAHLAEILKMVSVKKVKKNEMLLMRGLICRNVFFVEKGLLRLYAIDESGKEHIIQFAPENWFLSERASLYFGNPSEYFIDALEDSSLVVFDQEFIERASDISVEFRNYNEYLLQNHIRHLQNRIHSLIGADAKSRYLKFIDLYPEIVQRVPQWMVASYLGITPESLSRVRRDIALFK
ncbi:MAG: Crp/Fnr family transcriptional regulator [Saprospirales bacterium]|nr:MAG: Crp/Fnr family transcriptional regulator [Saprospirales bacterium]